LIAVLLQTEKVAGFAPFCSELIEPTTSKAAEGLLLLIPTCPITVFTNNAGVEEAATEV